MEDHTKRISSYTAGIIYIIGTYIVLNRLWTSSEVLATLITSTRNKSVSFF